MKKALLQLLVFAALSVVSTFAVTAGYALFVYSAGPFEGSGMFPWFVWVQWVYEAFCFGVIGYLIPRILNTHAGIAWAIALGAAFAALRWPGPASTMPGDLGASTYIATYGGYVIVLAAAVAGAYAAKPRKHLKHAA